VAEDALSEVFSYDSGDGTFWFHHSLDLNPRPQDFRLHYEGGYEIYMFIRGKGEYFVEGQRYELTPYSVLIFNTSELHKLEISVDEPYERMVIIIGAGFMPPFLVGGIDLLKTFRNRALGYKNKISAETAERYGLPALCTKFERLCRAGTPESEVVAKCVIIEMLTAINEAVSGIEDKAQTGNDKINAILEYINANLSGDLCLDALAEKFYLTKYYLCHIFKKTTGFTINRYVTYKRILLADGLMLDGYSPSQACFMSGYGDYSNFYKAYRKLTGKPPRKTKGAAPVRGAPR